MMIVLAFAVLLLVTCLLYVAGDDGGGSLLDDSEYERLVEFDIMLAESVNSLTTSASASAIGNPTAVAESLTLNYANVAMMYYQRNVRWKQGGNAQSLDFITLAIQAHSNASDAAHSDQTLLRSMLLHQARMLASLGRRNSALAIMDDLLDMYNTSNKVEENNILYQWWIQLDPAKPKSPAMSKQELSNILYHKAELMLTLFDDFQTAVDLFRQALELYPCHYLAHLQLVHALKAAKSATREDWLVEIARMEQYLMNTRQRPRHSMKHVHKYTAPLIDYVQSVPRTYIDTALDYTSISTLLGSLYNNVLHYYEAYVAPDTEVVCRFSNAHSTDSELYAYITPVRTVTSLYAIYSSVSWALFQAADSVPALPVGVGSSSVGADNNGVDAVGAGSGGPSDDEVKSVAWKYLQQARHFDRLRINEQYGIQEYQQAVLREQAREEREDAGLDSDGDGEEESAGNDNKQGTSAGPAEDNGGELSLEERADATAIQRSAAQTRHLVDFFQQGYWGDPAESELYYRNYQHPATTSAVGSASTAAVPATAQNDAEKAEGNSAAQRAHPNLTTTGPSVSVAELQRQGSKTRIPIFIVGFFRSGSTLLEGLLESHSNFRSDVRDSDANSQSAEGSARLNEEHSESHRAAETLGFRRRAIWGMGEDSPFVFEMYAMQEETLAAYANLEKQKQDLQGNKNKRKNGKKTVEALEQDFVTTYRQIVDKKASTIVGKMLQRFQHFHGADTVHVSNHTCINSGVIAGGTGTSGHIGASVNDTQCPSTTATTTAAAEVDAIQTPLPLRIVDKMLTNYVNIGLIHLVFPRAIILHTVRDPLDTLFSCYANRFGDPSAAYTLHLPSLVSKYVHYLEVMQHFRSVLPYYSLPIMRVKYNSTVKGGGRKVIKTTRRIQALVDVRYEELVANPERTLQHLLENVLGVPYAVPVRRIDASEGMPHSEKDNVTVAITDEGVSSTVVESKHKNSYVRVVQTASRLQVKQPVYHSSVGRWRKYKEQLQLTLIPALRPHLPRLAALQALPYLALDSSLVNNAASADNKASSKDSKPAGKCIGRNCVSMNWALDPSFDYDGMLQQLK